MTMKMKKKSRQKRLRMRKMRMKRRKSKTMMKGMKMMKNRKKNRMKNRKILKAKIDLKKEMSMRMMRIEMKRKIGKRKKSQFLCQDLGYQINLQSQKILKGCLQSQSQELKYKNLINHQNILTKYHMNKCQKCRKDKKIQKIFILNYKNLTKNISKVWTRLCQFVRHLIMKSSRCNLL